MVKKVVVSKVVQNVVSSYLPAISVVFPIVIICQLIRMMNIDFVPGTGL